MWAPYRDCVSDALLIEGCCRRLQSDAALDVTVASRTGDSFKHAQERWPALREVAYVPCDIDDTARLAEVLQVRRAEPPRGQPHVCSIIDIASQGAAPGSL